MKQKELLEGYVGVKYRALCRGEAVTSECRQLLALFERCGERLRRHGMTPANGGNMSQRGAGGFVITCSGCNLGCVEAGELVLVEGCSVEFGLVRRGMKQEDCLLQPGFAGQAIQIFLYRGPLKL